MTKLPCHELFETSGKKCGGNRYKTDWIPYLCPGCEQVAAKKLAEGKKHQFRAVFENAAAVSELLKQLGGNKNPRKSDGFLDLYK